MHETEDVLYCYSGTDILKNKLNIKDKKALEDYEKSIVSLKLLVLAEQGISGDFSKNHFISIHKFLFEEIYPFAGQFRKTNIAKDYFQFAKWEYIEPELDRLLNELKNENYLEGISKFAFIKRLAYYWSELNVLHPFREGNR